MVESLIIKNNTLNQEISLTKSFSAFLLANDNAIDWGTSQTTFTTCSTVSRIGVGINNISMDSGRVITIIGWVINDDFGTIEDKKHLLNYFCNPFDDITLIVGKYKISGHFAQPIRYSTQNKENNEIICKFMIGLFCDNPLFSLVESFETTSYGVSGSFTFPLVWQSSVPIVMGIQSNLGQLYLYNSGTLSTGFEVYIHINSDSVSGITITNVTTGEVFKTKSSVTFEAGDILYVNTTFGERTIKTGTDVGSLSEAFEVLDLSSDFVQIITGSNVLSLSVESGSVQSLSAEFTIKPLFYAVEEQ